MRRLWQRLVFWLLGGDRMREWRRDFPDRCPICAYHRYGIEEFHVTPGEPVPPHDCIERKPCPSNTD